MREITRLATFLTFALSTASLCGCSDSEDEGNNAGAAELATGEVDPSLFLMDGLLSEITEVDCELSDGTTSECYQITVHSEPTDHQAGPWCPRNIADGEEAGGIWPESGRAEAVDGAFIENLAEFYNDPMWQMFNEDDGSVNYTETLEECELAARPDVDPSLQNHCVECALEDLGDLEFTYMIPKFPKLLDTPQNIGGNMGIALNGVEFANAAPTDAILGAYTLAPFDDCGGHANPNAGYHYHAVTANCLTTVEQDDGHAGMIGFAMDGFPMHHMNDQEGEPDDLDECRGHSDSERGYHYHVSGAGENMIIGCWAGATVRGADDGGGPPGGGGPPVGPPEE